MKTMIALGLVMLFLLSVVILRRTNTNSRLVPGGEPASAEPQSISWAVPARRVASQMLRTTQQAQSAHPILGAAIEAESDSDHRTEALERAIESVSDAELPVTLDALMLDVSSGAVEMSVLLVRRWAESDAPAAATWASPLPENPVRRAVFEQIAIAWANTDLSAAADWVHALPDGASKQAATLALAYEAARTEPVVALDLTRTLAPTRARDDLLVHAISQWTETDSTTAATWAMNVADLSLRQRLVAAVAVASAAQAGEAAAMLAANVLGAGNEQNCAVVSIVQRWVQNAPQAAASWVSQFPDIPSREAAVQNLLALWTAQDAEAAGNWLRALPAGSLRDFGIAAYAQALADRDRTLAAVAPTGAM